MRQAKGEAMSVNLTQRVDLEVVADLIPPQSRVLDVGSGDGLLLELLQDTKQVDGRGLELSQRGVNECVARGLSVIQGDADKDLEFYPDKGFDFVVLSQTLQATRNPKLVLDELLRIGNRAIVSFPNFGHWRVRLSLLFRGRMPVTRALDQSWYETSNLHLCTVADFLSLARDCGAAIERAVVIDDRGRTRPMQPAAWSPNILAEGAIYLLRKR
jgi:methionine biosynthesis protein MetW